MLQSPGRLISAVGRTGPVRFSSAGFPRGRSRRHPKARRDRARDGKSVWEAGNENVFLLRPTARASWLSGGPPPADPDRRRYAETERWRIPHPRRRRLRNERRAVRWPDAADVARRRIRYRPVHTVRHQKGETAPSPPRWSGPYGADSPRSPGRHYGRDDIANNQS